MTLKAGGEAFINQIFTAVPPHDVHSAFVQYAKSQLDPRQQLLFQRLAKKSAIQHRYSFMNPLGTKTSLDQDGFYRFGQFPSLGDRMKYFEQHSMILADKLLLPLFSKHAADEFTHLIVTNCTGMMAPGLDLLIQKKWKMKPELERTNVFFMGCYAAVNALKLAHHIVRSTSSAKVLVVSLELCTLHLRESKNLEDLMGFLLFADGAAAAVVSSEANGIRMDQFMCHVDPDAAELITWKIRDQAFEMFLSMDVPKVLAQKLPQMVSSTTLSQQKPALAAIHPGGRAILDAVAIGLGLDESQMEPSRKILREFGNMSSATILFVLGEILQRTDLFGTGAALSFGPGFTMESMQFFKAGV